MQKIGFSQGVLNKVLDVYSKKAIDIYRNCGSEIIEIDYNKDETEKINIIVPCIKKFTYKSIHLPSDIQYKNDKKTKEILSKITEFYFNIKADLALIHPDVIEDWEAFNGFSLCWAIENMDNGKKSYKKLEEIKNFFVTNNDWNMVLDLNHCYSNDRSMQLAEAFIKELGSKIVEIHLSGYETLHEPLYKTKQIEILRYCKNINRPIIIESILDSIDEIAKEYNYIDDFLNSSH